MANLKEAVYENGVITMPTPKYEIYSKGIGYQYFKSMTKHKDKIFQLDVITGEKDLFGSTLQRCVRVAIKMRSMGVKPDDIITICSYNSLNSCVPHIAASLLGAIPTNLDPEIAFSDSVHLLKQFDPKLIFVEDNSLDLIERVVQATEKTSPIVVFTHSDKYIDFSEFLKPSPEEETFQPVEVVQSKTGIIIFSSGTSGLLKGICLSHQAHLKQAFLFSQVELFFDLTLTFSRLCWSTAVCFLGVLVLRGESKLIIPKFSADLAWKVIEEFKPTLMISSPFQMATLCGKSNCFDYDTSSIKTVQKNIFKEDVKLGYGLTELGLVTYNIAHTKDYLDRKAKSIGSALDGLSYKVVDIDTRRTLGPSEFGELLIRTEHQLSGYYNLDSSEVWDSDGWFRTGDIVYYDEEYYFYYVERLKEVIKYKTSHVTPKFIEKLLYTHPKVRCAVVIGLLHEIDCEHPMALVQLKNGCNGNNIEEELFDLVANNMEDKYRLRGGVKILDQFPFTATGKIDLFKLKRQYRSC